MSSCTYHLINDLYEAMDTDLKDIATKLDEMELNINVEELDLDLDNIEKQLIINNKLRLLELIGIDIMTEEEQIEAYQAIKEELFSEEADTNADEDETEGDGADLSG